MNQPSPLALLFALLTVVFTVIGQLFVQAGMLELGAMPRQTQPPRTQL